MKNYRYLGLIFSCLGTYFFLQETIITGAVTGLSRIHYFSSYLTMSLLLAGLLLVLSATEEHHIQRSLVKKDPLLLREARKIGENDDVRRGIQQLITQLDQGNTNPGLGTKQVSGSVSELRHRNGARVYFRPAGEGTYEILAYSDKHNQERVIDRVSYLYGQ